MCMGSVKSIKLDFCKSCGRMQKNKKTKKRNKQKTLKK